MRAHFTDLSEGQIGFHTVTPSGNCSIWEKPWSTFCCCSRPPISQTISLLFSQSSGILLLIQPRQCLHLTHGFRSSAANKKMRIFCNLKGWNLAWPLKHRKLAPSWTPDTHKAAWAKHGMTWQELRNKERTTTRKGHEVNLIFYMSLGGKVSHAKWTKIPQKHKAL